VHGFLERQEEGLQYGGELLSGVVTALCYVHQEMSTEVSSLGFLVFSYVAALVS